MEYLFQADINGSLEKLERIEQGYDTAERRAPTSIILQPLLETIEDDTDKQLSYTEKLDVCHSVLFNAWKNRSDSLTSFSVSRYKRGVLPNEYYELIEHFGFTERFKASMYALDSEEAVVFFQEILPFMTTVRLFDYLPAYLRICHSLSEESFVTAINKLCQYIKDHVLDLAATQRFISTVHNAYRSLSLTHYQCIGYYGLIEQVYASAVSIINSKLSFAWNSLLNTIHTKYDTILSQPGVKRISLTHTLPHRELTMKITRSIRDETNDDDIMAAWNASSALRSSQRRHEYAFELVCMTICKHAAPSGTRHSNEMEQEFVKKWSSSCNLLLDTLYLNRQGMHPSFAACMEVCLESLLNLSGSWRSIVKAMAQFADLWTTIMINNEVVNAFADLIVMTRTWKDLFECFIKMMTMTLKYSQERFVTERTKEDVYTLLDAVLEQMEINDLLKLLYDTYSERSQIEDESDIISRKLDLYDQSAALQKCCNQFVDTGNENNTMTTEDQPQVESHLLRQLAKIATISPFDTVKRLIMQCIENKGQDDIVAAILEQLGDLCMLRRYEGDKTLVTHVLESLLNGELRDAGLNSLAPLLSTFWKKAKDPTLSILLNTYTSTVYNVHGVKILLQPNELLDDLLIPTLKHADRDQTKNILSLLYALTDDTSTMGEKWQQQLQSYNHSTFQPILLHMDFETLMLVVTYLMNERLGMNTTDYLNITDDGYSTSSCLSISLDLGHKLIMTIIEASKRFDAQTGLETTVKERFLPFYDSLTEFDWRTRLFWEEGFSYVSGNTKSPLYAPRAVISLIRSFVNTSDVLEDQLWHAIDTHESMETDDTQNWILFLNGCRTTKFFTDRVFDYASRPEFNMPAIARHPYDSTLLKECLIYNLHPCLSMATHYEYRLLLVHLLGRVYDAHSSLDLIRCYPSYDDKVKVFVQALTPEHCRLFFMVLHSLELLKIPESIKSATESQGEDNLKGELFYVLGIVQSIQSTTDWQHFGEKDAYYSQSFTNNIIARIIDDSICSPLNFTFYDNQDDNAISDGYYPWLDPIRISVRAMYLLIIYAICDVAKSVYSRKSYDVLRVLLLQIVEGLENRHGRQRFMARCDKKQQPKSAIAKWKRSKKGKRIRIHLRDILTPQEADFIKDCSEKLPYAEDQSVLMNLLAPFPPTTLYTHY